MNEPADLLVPLQRLAAAGAYDSAVAELTAARDEPDSERRLARLREALAPLERLAAPFRQLAWLATFGSPRCVRLDAVAVRESLWRRGVTRSTEGLLHLARATRLLAGVAVAPREEIGTLLRRLRIVGAFDTLVPSLQPECIAAEAVGLVLAVDPASIHQLAEAAVAAEIKSVSAASSLARWMHALAKEGAPDAPPPEGDAARFVLAAPILRGLRRHGAREHGRRLGRLAAENVRQRTGAADGSFQLPKCLTATAQVHDLMVPLVLDFVTAAIAEFAPKCSRREGAHNFADGCPAVVDAAAAVLGTMPNPDHVSRVEWLENALGLAPQPRWHLPSNSFELAVEPTDLIA